MIRFAIAFCLLLAPALLRAQTSGSTDSLVAINVAALNSNGNDICPFLPFGENNIYFTRQLAHGGGERIWKASRNPDSTWSNPTAVPETDKLGVIGSLISDSLGEIFFASTYGKTEPNDMDLFSLTEGKPLNLGVPINTTRWESQPSITADGKDLYFASNREGLPQKVRIFVSHRSSDGKWSQPVSIGTKVNSSDYNGTPFIAGDNKSLLFASDENKLKLYLTVKTGSNDTDWSNPIELPFPINTSSNNSMSPCLSHDNHELYFASDRPGGKGRLDIYMVRLPHGLESLYLQPTK